jgi:uncharacterized protein YndB with AHSA1/START domain
MAMTAHVYEIFINAPPERVWQALIDPEFTRQYLHGTSFESSFEPGSGFRGVRGGDGAVDGTIEVFEPPHRLVMTWHVLYDTAMSAEPPGRVEWLVAPATADRSVTRVTLRHGDLAFSPSTWEHVRLGWVEIIDSLKTLLETGRPMPEVDRDEGGPAPASSEIEAQWHRRQGIEANNMVWELLDGRSYTSGEIDELLSRAYAAAFHWARAAGREPANAARGSWLLSRCHVVLGHGDLALHHADKSADMVADAGLTDFDLGYALEARARALACLGRLDEAAIELGRAFSTEVADDEDRSIFESDLVAEPWFGLELPDFEEHAR